MPAAAIPLLIMTAVLALASLVIAVIIWLIRRICGRRRPGYWRRVLWVQLCSLPVFLLLGPPATLTYFAGFEVGTRGDERAYAGPRVDAGGHWSIQKRNESMAQESRGERVVDPAVLLRARSRAVRFSSADGVSLNGYLVPALTATARFQVVLVHGLFRNAMETETVGSMFHALGADVLLLELRNHGSSGRSRATFGRDESNDVLAAVVYLRSREGAVETPLVLYGVSLGAAAVSLAAPLVADLSGLVLDAPMASLAETAENLMRSGIGLFEPYLWMIRFGVESINDFDMDEIRPVDSLKRLPPDIPVLIIGATDDFRTPPDAVRAVYAALRAPEGVKQLWIAEGARHGRVFEHDPEGYRTRLEALVKRVLSRVVIK